MIWIYYLQKGMVQDLMTYFFVLNCLQIFSLFNAILPFKFSESCNIFLIILLFHEFKKALDEDAKPSKFLQSKLNKCTT